ncbi:hypothetical protein MASR2M44_14750 [Bacteroidota bacterium]
MRNRYLIALIFVFVYFLVFLRMSRISVYTEGRARSAILGDGFSDINTLSSAHYFLDSGFTKTAWLPVHEYYPPGSTPQVYTHYPALPNLLCGVYASLFQSTSEPLLRLIPVLLSMVFFGLIFRFLKKLTGDSTKALIGSAGLWLGSYFINWADNLHQHLYGELLKWLYVYVMYLYFQGGRKQIGLLLTMLVIMILEVNISFEQPVYLGIATLGFSLVYKHGVFSRENILAFLAIWLGFGLHLYQNAIYFGSWKAALDDMIHAFTFRATGAETVGYIKEKEYTWRNFPEIMFGWFNGMERFYVLPGWSLLTLWILLGKQLWNKQTHLVKLAIALFAASISWGFVMSQHAYVHAFTNKHFSIFVGLSLALLIPEYLQRLKTDWQSGNTGLRIFHTVLIAYSASMFISQQVWEIWLRYGLFYPHFGT